MTNTSISRWPSDWLKSEQTLRARNSHVKRMLQRSQNLERLMKNTLYIAAVLLLALAGLAVKAGVALPFLCDK